MSTINDLCNECQRERDLFKKQSVQKSSACLALFRFSIAQNQEARDCFYRIFEKDVTVYVMRWAKYSHSSLNKEQIEDIVQDVFANILRSIDFQGKKIYSNEK